MVKAKESKKYGVPAILSFLFPGLGQIVKGEVMKGIGFIFAAIISVVLMFVVIGFVIYPIVWIYGVYDAYNAQVD